MKLTTNFTREEFDCNDGTKVPAELMQNVKELAENLQVLRDFLNCAVDVDSGYRHPAYNKKVGGGTKSQHLLAKAGDIPCEDLPFTPRQLARIIKGLIRLGLMKEGGIGIYTKDDFVHYDTRGKAARWTG
jgi:uncharacterized protein YcbK (DUF882 family)